MRDSRGKHRGIAQERADHFDLELFRLMQRAEDYSRQHYETQWAQVKDLLSQARPIVRAMMHPADRERTS